MDTKMLRKCSHVSLQTGSSAVVNFWEFLWKKNHFEAPLSWILCLENDIMNSRVVSLTPEKAHSIYKCLSSTNYFCKLHCCFFPPPPLNMITGNVSASHSAKNKKKSDCTLKDLTLRNNEYWSGNNSTVRKLLKTTSLLLQPLKSKASCMKLWFFFFLIRWTPAH